MRRILIAFDFDSEFEALALLEKLDARFCRIKVGKAMFTRFGPKFVEKIQARGFEVFLDLKFHDIPNTVSDALRAAADLGVWMVNVHALGGARMLEAASNALAHYQKRPLLIAVTVLTSMQEDDLKALSFSLPLSDLVLSLAHLSADSGLDGVVCSPREASLIKKSVSQDFLTVTPGIRPKGVALDDQVRVLSPCEALVMGSDYLVIGRAITKANDPLLALREIVDSIGGGV